MKFRLESTYAPAGDQPEAIKQICSALTDGVDCVTLLGVTGSGKTFTMANVIEKLQRPVLVLSHNKTLAAQLYGEFKSFFPDNAVEYFVSYYDYYQPESYIPSTDTYIEKDLSINDQIEKLRLSAASSLLSGRRDVIVVASVSCLYGIGNPEDFHAQTINIKKGEQRSQTRLLYQLVDALYSRTAGEFSRGSFRVSGDTVDIFPGGADTAVRVEFFGDEVDGLSIIEPSTGARIEDIEEISIFPANNYVTTRERSNLAISQIQDDLVRQMAHFESEDKALEAKRLKQRVEYDLEMIKEMGYCPGIENYSRYFDGRREGQRPFCLLDYFPDDFITFVDESHVTLPEVRAMAGGDRSRKANLIQYGFRLPAAADNRPLTFEEFESVTHQCIYVSATPAEYELERCQGLVVEQVVRPTGLLDPPIEVRPVSTQTDDLLEEIRKRSEMDERVLATTTTKAFAEKLDDYCRRMGVRSRYIHSDVDTAERVEIIEDFKNGMFDVLIGVNLLREGLDIPNVSLVAILDADHEGFLRNNTALTQTAGRAARNVNGLVIMYADSITKSMDATIRETRRRREKQIEYNESHGIVPKQIAVRHNSLALEIGKEDKSTRFPNGVNRLSAPNSYESPVFIPDPSNLGKGSISVDLGLDSRRDSDSAYVDGYVRADLAAVLQDPVIRSMSRDMVEKLIEEDRKKMKSSAAALDFTQAARYRDEMWALEQYIKVWKD